ncbi:MAG: hypothetical protein KDD82_25390, partial [Planctomycetes bacterium]|nr:hypothetical protein [Planctomycetota bacterium]
MGNLNKFYLLGRVAKAPEASGAGPNRVAKVWLSPGTAGGNRRRGASLPMLLHAYGPQVEVALELRVGQGVLARGQLRQEPQGAGDALVAQVQAFELLSSRPRRVRPEGEGEGEGEGGEGGERSEGGAEEAGEDGR